MCSKGQQEPVHVEAESKTPAKKDSKPVIPCPNKNGEKGFVYDDPPDIGTRNPAQATAVNAGQKYKALAGAEAKFSADSSTWTSTSLFLILLCVGVFFFIAVKMSNPDKKDV